MANEEFNINQHEKDLILFIRQLEFGSFHVVVHDKKPIRLEDVKKNVILGQKKLDNSK